MFQTLNKINDFVAQNPRCKRWRAEIEGRREERAVIKGGASVNTSKRQKGSSEAGDSAKEG